MIRAVFNAIITLIGFVVLAIAFIDSGKIVNLIISGSIFLFGVYVSVYVFRLVKNRPFGDLSPRSTPDLNNLTPAPGSGIIEISAEKLCDLFNKENWKFSPFGRLKIWGDWQHKHLDVPKYITNMSYQTSSHLLSIVFDKGKLQIINPRIIHASKGYLKIIFADKILWKWDDNSSLIYEKIDLSIIRYPNLELEVDELEVDATQPALIFV